MNQGDTAAMDTEEDNGLVQWARRRIKSLWRLVTATSSSCSSNNNKKKSRSKGKGKSNRNNNKRRQKPILDVKNNDDNYNDKNLLVSGGLPLTSIVSYLEPHDVLNCIQTCKQWKNDMDTDGVWCEVAKNVSPIVVDAIIQQQSNNNNDNDNDNDTTTTKLNYRNIAIAISRGLSDYDYHEKRLGKDIPVSKLQLKDILVVIEIRDRSNNNKSLGVFCGNLTDLTDNKPGLCQSVSFDPNNKDSKRKDPFSSIILPILPTEEYNNGDDYYFAEDYDDYCCQKASERLEMTLRLIRRDTGKCIYLGSNDSMFIMYKGDKITHFETTTRLVPTAKTLFGKIAKRVFYENDYLFMSFYLNILIDRVRVSDFDYKIKSFKFGFRESTSESIIYPQHEFESVNHFLLFLEGIDWK